MRQEVITVSKKMDDEKNMNEGFDIPGEGVMDEDEIIDEVIEEDLKADARKKKDKKPKKGDAAKIQELEKQVAELENKYYMAYADAQNLAKRAKVDAEHMVNNKVSSMVQHILPALDNFERAVSIKTDDEKTLNFLKGFKMVYDQLYSALEREGVKQIEAVGKEFNPELHQSLGTVEDEKYIPNTVAQEVQKGYTFRGKVIRPAMVKITKE